MNSRSTPRAAPLALLVLGACATTHRPVVAPPTPAADGSAPAAVPARPAPQDYTPTGLFAEEHGDFLAKADRFRPSVTGTFAMLPNASLNNEPGDFDLARFQTGGRIPLVIDPDSVFLVGARAEARRYEFSSGFGVPDENLGSVGLEFGYGRFLNRDTYAHATFEPGIYSDFEGTLHHQDYKFFGEGLVVFRYAEDLYFKGGVRVSEDFADAPVYPMAGLSWIANEQWRVDILLPRRAEVSYQPQTPTTFYAGIDLEGQEYHLRSSAATGRQEFDFQVQEIRVYVGGIHRFTDHLSAFGRFGAAVAGDHKLRSDNNLGRRINGQLDPTLLFEVGVGWDF